MKLIKIYEIKFYNYMVYGEFIVKLSKDLIGQVRGE